MATNNLELRAQEIKLEAKKELPLVSVQHFLPAHQVKLFSME
jgi:hypothetical protein